MNELWADLWFWVVLWSWVFVAKLVLGPVRKVQPPRTYFMRDQKGDRR